jgi:hypothetical protein
MSRRFKIGDKVRMFLDASVAGKIVDIRTKPALHWISEGTSSIEFLVDVMLSNGSVKTVKMSDLYHDDI